MRKTESEINYNYATIKQTKGRISKGLIALPKDLTELFPANSANIQIYLDDSRMPSSKKFTSVSSKTRESRIGGMRKWFDENRFKDGDEIVIQVIDKGNFTYRLIPEEKFISTTKKLQRSFDKSENDEEATEKISTLAKWTELDKGKVIWNEFYRYAFNEKMENRQYISRTSEKAKETAPSNYRIILGGIYRGLCQICRFGFLKRDNNPYFELHHIKPEKGNHPKNLLLVCANCHRQFEYSNVETDFNTDGWLIGVMFNRKKYSINQLVLKTKFYEFHKQIYTPD